jgi:hypothetical protein
MTANRALGTVCTLGFLLTGRLDAQVEPLLLSQACFDSLPYGSTHLCTGVLQWRSVESLDTLRTRIEAALVHDSAHADMRQIRKKAIAFAVEPHSPKGCCRHPFDTVDSVGALARLRFDASKGHKGTLAALAVEGRARIYEGGSKYPLMLVLCYLAHYTAALGVSLPQNQGD